MSKAMMLINGSPPRVFPDIEMYDVIYCTDGAYPTLLAKKIRPDYVVGDFDSISMEDLSPQVQAVLKPDQDYTDFHKCLELLVEHGVEAVDVFGSTGMEHDHYLGNLSTALKFKDDLDIVFYDDYATFFFADNDLELEGVNERIISLYPFPHATNVQSNGLFFPLNGMDLEITQQIGTRNHATEDIVHLSYDSGNLIIFISNYTLEEKDSVL